MSQLFSLLNDFLDNQKKEIYAALALIGLTDALFAALFTLQFAATHQFRNYMILGSHTQPCSWSQFLMAGGRWLAFANLFFFVPAILISMLLPRIVELARSAQEND